MNILIIDDSNIMRRMIKKALTDTQFFDADTLEAADGEEGLKVFKENDVDFVLCDWIMPNMDGLEFVVQARKVQKDKYVPIVMVTTEGEVGKIDKALQRGADRYVTKPFTPIELEKNLLIVAKKINPPKAA